jgi:DtxR family transcriptional regulator, Mn-dependent transcriptional regulator
MASRGSKSEIVVSSALESGHSTPGRRRRLTPSQEDYLKALYDLGGARASVNTSPVARRLQVSVASVTEMLGKLDALGLVHHDRYHGVGLTADGEAAALEMVRHHRLIETYLVEKLGYTWDEVHEEAELLEHVISEQMEQRISDALGHPAVDCHGDPIPDPAGAVAATGYASLMQAQAGEQVTVRRVSDRDSGVLRMAHELGLRLGARLEILAESDYDGPISIRVQGRRRLIPIGIARAVFVG